VSGTRNPLLIATLLALVVLAGCASGGGATDSGAAPYEAPPVDPASRVKVTADSDLEAIRIAQEVMKNMGGWQAWDSTRYIRWNFFGTRTHYWDRFTGNLRIEGPFSATEENAEKHTILMNIHTGEGRAWNAAGEELLDPGSLARALKFGKSAWINDSYWMFMPYKMLDPGVTLGYNGEVELEDGRLAEELVLTFSEGVGETPHNQYLVHVMLESGLVESWSFFNHVDQPAPDLTMPWGEWQQFGRIKLATYHGRAGEWDIAVFDDLPASVFESADPVTR